MLMLTGLREYPDVSPVRLRNGRIDIKQNSAARARICRAMNVHAGDRAGEI